MVEYKFSVRDGQLPSSGFDLGDMDVTGNLAGASSRGHSPDRGMMIYPSVAHLLDGLRIPLGASRGNFEFIAVDSSFSLEFRINNGWVFTSIGKRRLDESSTYNVANAVLRAARELMLHARATLPDGEAASVDLAAALADFSRFLE